MPGETFEVRVVRGDSGPTLLMGGTVNRSAKGLLEEAYDGAADIEGELSLDFNAVDYINSTGIAVIVGVLAKARAADRDVAAFGLTPHYREVFEITRLSDFMRIHDEATTEE